MSMLRPLGSSFLASVLVLSSNSFLAAQNAAPQKRPVITGTISDTENRPLAGAEVLLQGPQATKPLSSTTNAHGQFRFEVTVGTYTLKVKHEGYEQGSEGPFPIQADEVKSVVLHLARIPSAPLAKDAASTMQFSDEPQFSVAGVTDTSALGVHASSRTMPNSQALAKDTVALSREEASATPASSLQKGAIRAKLATQESADLRFQLAEILEKEGHIVEAEKDYQRAAELDPTEPHLFSWGTELLLHRAFEPAIEVFTKGNRLYPRSVRMLLGLGATRYAQGAREEAAEIFLRASALDLPDPRPYLFLGRLLATENTVPAAWPEAMERFTILHAENATAHYLYGFALVKQDDELNTPAAQAQLELAIQLDPHLGEAYLQLGILQAKRKQFASAVASFEKAIEYMRYPDEAHYRLAEVYRRTGETGKAHQETTLYKQISEQKSREAERERHEIQQFVYTLSGAPPAQTPASHPH